MGKKKVKAPKYQEFEDNEYIAGLRQDLPGYRDYSNKLLYSLDVTDPKVQEQYQKLANDYTQSMWNDLSRKYIDDYNTLNQRNYNRFGSLGSTSALYAQDTLQRDYNDLSSRLASQTADAYQNLINNYYNQKLSSYNAANQAYTNAGTTTTAIDQNNWNIRNKNIEAKYVADLQNAQGGIGNIIGGGLSGAISGAGTGAVLGGPVGAVIGGVAGAGLGALGGSQSSSGGQAIGSGFGIGSSVGNLGTLGNYIGGSNIGSSLNLNTKGSGFNPSFSGYVGLGR